jgi:hypothetical protein
MTTLHQNEMHTMVALHNQQAARGRSARRSAQLSAGGAAFNCRSDRARLPAAGCAVPLICCPTLMAALVRCQGTEQHCRSQLPQLQEALPSTAGMRLTDTGDIMAVATSWPFTWPAILSQALRLPTS